MIPTSARGKSRPYDTSDLEQQLDSRGAARKCQRLHRGRHAQDGCGHMGRPLRVMGVAQRGLSQPAPTGEQSLQHKRLRPQPLPDTSQLAPEVRLPSRQWPSTHKHDGAEPQNAPHAIVGGTGSVLARQTPQQLAFTLNTQSASLAHRPPPAAPSRPSEGRQGRCQANETESPS